MHHVTLPSSSLSGSTTSVQPQTSSCALRSACTATTATHKDRQTDTQAQNQFKQNHISLLEWPTITAQWWWCPCNGEPAKRYSSWIGWVQENPDDNAVELQMSLSSWFHRSTTTTINIERDHKRQINYMSVHSWQSLVGVLVVFTVKLSTAWSNTSIHPLPTVYVTVMSKHI